MNSLQWFRDRIGKRIYRDTNNCHCDYCKDIYLNGIVVKNGLHAQYLFDIQNDIGYNYSDVTKNDRTKENSSIKETG
jgi:hypothetical protein